MRMPQLPVFNKKHLIILAIALLHWLTTFYTEGLYFEPIHLSSEHLFSYVLNKLLLMSTLLFLYYGLYEVLITKNLTYRQVFRNAMMFFVPMMLLLIVIWPGPIADGDIPFYMTHEVIYSYNYYLHYITSLVHIQGLMLFPFLTGILIYQLIGYALIVGYIITRAIDYFKSPIVYLLYLIFLVPSMAFYTLLLNRTPIYGYLLLLLISILYFDYASKLQMTLPKISLILLLGAILTVLRYEGIYFLITLPLLIPIVYRQKAFFKVFLVSVLCLFVTVNIISIPQKLWENKYAGDFASKRLMPALVHNISNMLAYGVEGDFETIDRVVSVDLMRQYASISNIMPLIMGAERVGEYTPEELIAYAKASTDIIKNYPLVFLKVRWRTFIASALYGGETKQDLDTYREKVFKGKSLFIDPLFDKPRTHALHFLGNLKGLKGSDTYSFKPLAWLQDLSGLISYNLFIPIGFLGLVFIVGLIKRNWFWVLVSFGAFVHIGLIALLAPASYFMYYVPVNMIGWFVGALMAIAMILHLSKKESRPFFVKD